MDIAFESCVLLKTYMAVANINVPSKSSIFPEIYITIVCGNVAKIVAVHLKHDISLSHVQVESITIISDGEILLCRKSAVGNYQRD